MASEVYLILLLFFAQSTALELTINEDKPYITYLVNENQYAISLHEEMAVPIKLGSFVTTGTNTPVVEFSAPDNANNNLGLTVTETSSNIWEIDITLRQDYESSFFSQAPRYSFEIRVGSENVIVTLDLININDNAPIITASTANCQITEHDTTISDCVYTVYDSDGHITTLTTSLGDDDDTFEFLYDAPAFTSIKEAELRLKPIKELDYEFITLYVMNLIVTDTPIVETDTSLEGQTRIVVEVLDIADTPPVWTSIFASKVFDEMEEQTFDVAARDGDLGINDVIIYSTDESWSDYISIENLTGVINVEPIDRDAEGLQIFSFMIFACELNEPFYCINQTIAFLVNDINNKVPVISVTSDTVIEIDENFYDDLGFIISVDDLDLGENAMYELTLSSTIDQHTAFTVAPSTGYQQTSIFIYITNYRLLDYENVTWQDFTLTLTTKDSTEPFNTDSVDFSISLSNLNDEVPQFINTDGVNAYIAEIEETAPANTPVITVTAEDRDIDDLVVYSLMGTYINSILSVDELGGNIVTLIDGAFDYETQEEVIVQIQAIDTLAEPYNTAIAQITITVIDINDETPRITVGSERVEIEENLSHDTQIVSSTANFLVATDDDQYAVLDFDINWSNSYATKTGRRLDDEKFEIYSGCIRIETVDNPLTGNTKGKSARALLYINEVLEDNTPDYETFDILYLNVEVTDTNQTYGTNMASVTVPIYILDVDDVPPEFQQSTIDSPKSVVEESVIDSTIAIIIATDVDSEEIFYYIEAEEELYEGCVGINEIGELYVLSRIDADIPIYYMNFTVIASDGERNTSALITITVVDINDNYPTFYIPERDQDFTVYEESDDGTVIIAELIATDDDRDAPNNVVSYRFSDEQSNPLIRNYFAFQGNSFIVSYTNSEDKLDRDNAIPGITNTINIEAVDGNINSPLVTSHAFSVTLLDINNKEPTITTTLFDQQSENLKAHDRVGQIVGEDLDTDIENRRINFVIESITTNAGEATVDEMFYLANADPDAGTVDLMAGIDMEGYHGTYILEIKSEDEGTNPGPLSSDNTVTVIINKYNFEAPSFISPQNGSKLLLRLEQTQDGVLFQYNDAPLSDFNATDHQGDKYQLEFSVLESEVFGTRTMTATTARLELISSPDTSDTYSLTLRVQAVDASPERVTDISVTVQFVDSTAEPTFTTNTGTISFLENTTGLSAEFPIARYDDIPDELLNEYRVHYIIAENSAGFVIEDSTVNRISITNVLDREDIDSHIVQIQSSRTEGGVAVPQAASVLTLTIEVIDINDNPPYFDQPTFFGSITSSTSVGSTITRITATDEDIDDVLTYYIDGYENLPTNVNDGFFNINQASGDITSTSTVSITAEGYFLINVRVSDGEHFDTATVNIYIVSDIHKVEFVFQNEMDAVTTMSNQISSILEAQFNYTCIIDNIEPNTDDENNLIEGETLVAVHFVNAEENSPIIRSSIEIEANNINVYQSLMAQFNRFDLILLRFLQSTSTTENMEEVLRAWLIGVTVVLGTLCVLLLVAFILKTRSLSKRLGKLSVIRYGSQESVSNRKAAPLTNRHAAEGSNPAYSEHKIRAPENDDAASIGSGDSDLVGVENNPEFDYKYEKQNGNA